MWTEGQTRLKTLPSLVLKLCKVKCCICSQPSRYLQETQEVDHRDYDDVTFDFGTGTNGEMVVLDLVKNDNSDIMKVKKIGADVCMSPEETTIMPTTTGIIRYDLS